MDNSNKIILDLCGGTGSWSRPYKENGYDVRIITLPEFDILDYEPPERVYGVLAAPPCTAFSLASVKYWSEYDNSGFTDYSLKLVKRCFDIAAQCNPKFFALENPKGRLRKLLGINPIYHFYQYEFDGLFYKPTYLWGDFNTLIVKGPINDNPIYLQEAKYNLLYDLPDDYILDKDFSIRAAKRSVYPNQFANAFYEANM